MVTEVFLLSFFKRHVLFIIQLLLSFINVFRLVNPISGEHVNTRRESPVISETPRLQESLANHALITGGLIPTPCPSKL